MNNLPENFPAAIEADSPQHRFFSVRGLVAESAAPLGMQE